MSLNSPLSVYQSEESQHGRKEKRVVEVFENKALLPKGWKHIQRLVRVHRSGLRKGKPFVQTSIYILSKPIDEAQIVAQGVRGHWSIENNLHWVKDVRLREDDMSITQERPATAVAILNTIALNLIRTAGYKPSKDTFAFFSNKIKELSEILCFNRTLYRT